MKKLAFSLAFLMVLLSMAGAYAAPNATVVPNPIVEVEQGLLEGYMDEGISAFLGVPYAKAARFEMPEKPDAWEGVRKAQAYGAIAPIPEQTSVGWDEFVWPHRYWSQNEDCQFVNIWSKNLDETAAMPVMVFFHGGGHTNGSSIESVAYEGRNLAEFGDVVVVTLNHRLNALGYLDLSSFGEEYKDSANLGIADLIAALQWINDNIAQFGGDPNNVLIFGQSGGGGKVDAVLHAPSAEGLVHRGIMQSGGLGTLNSRTKEDTQLLGELVVAELGLDASTIDEIKAVPYRTLLEATTAATAKAREIKPNGSFGWGPVADGEFMTIEFPEWAKSVPIMTGAVFSESAKNSVRTGDGRKNEWTEEETMSWLESRFGDDVEAILAEFSALYPNKGDADAFFYNNTNGRFTRAYSLITEETGAPVYGYMFNYEAPVNGGVTAFHCVELIYAFHNVDIPIIKRATGGLQEAYDLQDVVAQAWVNFARTGNPSQEGLEWPAFDLETKTIMQFDVVSGTVANYDDSALSDLIAGR